MEDAPGLGAALAALLSYRLVFFAGMPATGKSLLVNQLAHLAHAAGREVHLLHWDVARPVFEASPAGTRYPRVNGVTHPAIRRTTGLWAREAVAAWSREHASGRDLLIGETPLIGNRFVELAQRHDDASEAVLRSDGSGFVLTVPSTEVKAAIETERRRRALAPLNAREREDAPPQLLDQMWRELVAAGAALGLVTGPSLAYDAGLYRRVYERLLRHRPLEVLRIDRVLPVGAISPYDFDFEYRSLLPSESQTSGSLARALSEADIEPWWEV